MKDIGVSFTVIDYAHTKTDLEDIDTVVKALFHEDYKKLDDVYSDGEWQIVYLLQCPIMESDSEWNKFFDNLKHLLLVTSDYNSSFYNEPEAEVMD